MKYRIVELFDVIYRVGRGDERRRLGLHGTLWFPGYWKPRDLFDLTWTPKSCFSSKPSDLDR